MLLLLLLALALASVPAAGASAGAAVPVPVPVVPVQASRAEANRGCASASVGLTDLYRDIAITLDSTIPRTAGAEVIRGETRAAASAGICVGSPHGCPSMHHV